MSVVFPPACLTAGMSFLAGGNARRALGQPAICLTVGVPPPCWPSRKDRSPPDGLEQRVESGFTVAGSPEPAQALLRGLARGIELELLPVMFAGAALVAAILVGRP